MRTRRWRGGALTAATGEQVRIEVSSGYSAQVVSPQVWADFFARLVHGEELATVTVRIAPPGEVAAECGPRALACYGAGVLVMPGELVTRPWSAPARMTVAGRFQPGGPRRRLVPVTTPLDGVLTADLRLPRGRLDTLELLSADGRVLARGLWAGTSTRRLFTVCGQRRLVLRVTRTRLPGRFQLTVARP